MTDSALQSKAPAQAATDDSEGMSYLESLPRRLVTLYLPLFIILVVLLFPFYWMVLTSIGRARTPLCGRRSCVRCERGRCHRQACGIRTTPPTIPWRTTSRLHSIERRQHGRILAGRARIA